jgi:AraC-like DNA-binding protein
MLLALDDDRQIVGANRSARDLLGLSSEGPAPAGLGVWALLERNEALFRHGDRGDLVAEVRPVGRSATWSAAVTPPQPSSGRWRDAPEQDIRLRPRLDTIPHRCGAIEPIRGGIAPAKLRRIREYVENNLGQPIDLKALAGAAGLSVYHFARTFKQSEGLSPHAYVLERRIAKARNLLARTDLPLSVIALELGFADQSHFARRFRQTVGVSPGKYRRS